MKFRFLILLVGLVLLVSCGDGINSSFSASGDDATWSLMITKDRVVHFNKKGMDKEIVFSIADETYIGYLHSHKEGNMLFEFNILDRDCPKYSDGDHTTNQVIIRLNGDKYLGCGQFRD